MKKNSMFVTCILFIFIFTSSFLCGIAHENYEGLDEILETYEISENAKRNLKSLCSTCEGTILLNGWIDASDHEYDISKLTRKEKLEAIENGIAVLVKKHNDDNDYLSPIVPRALTGYYHSKKDHRKTIYWAFKGAENGCSACMGLLSDFYKCGDKGLVQDFEEALMWTYLAAALGNQPCSNWVKEYGHGFFTGRYEEINREGKRRANRWMQEHPEVFFSP